MTAEKASGSKSGVSDREREKLQSLVQEKKETRKTKQELDDITSEKSPLTAEQRQIAALIQQQRKRGEGRIEVLDSYKDPPSLTVLDLPRWAQEIQDEGKWVFVWPHAEDVPSRTESNYYRFDIVNRNSPFAGRIPSGAYDMSGGIVRRNQGEVFVLCYINREHFENLLKAPGEISRSRLGSAKESAKEQGFYDAEHGMSDRTVSDGAFREMPVGTDEARASILTGS